MELIILVVIVLVVNAVIKSNTQKQNAQRKLEEMKERAKIPGLPNRQEPPAQPVTSAAPSGTAPSAKPAAAHKLHRTPLQTDLAAQRSSAPVMPQVQPPVLQAAPQAPLRTANAAPADAARMPVKKSGVCSEIHTMDLKQMVVMKEILDKPVSRRAGRMGARR